MMFAELNVGDLFTIDGSINPDVIYKKIERKKISCCASVNAEELNKPTATRDLSSKTKVTKVNNETDNSSI